MSTGVENVLDSTPVWSDEICRLKDFQKRHTLPAIALIQKGTYRGIGQSQGQSQQIIYIHDVKTGQKVLVEEVKQKVLGEGMKQNSRKARGMKYSLPVTYGGWFEVLSEDGKPIQPIQGVEELSKAAPQQCLVREAFKSPVSGPSSEDLSTERLRQLNVGERLTLRGEVEVAFQGSRGGVAKKRYLRCSDDRGEYVYLPLDLRTQFSPIAGPNNIAGVHTVKGLLEKFRLPIIVRLIHGEIPARVQRSFSPVFRLLGAYTDETAFIIPFPVKDNKMVTISTREPLILAPARNWEALRKSSEFEDSRARCETSIKSYFNSVHILVDSPDPAVISRGKEWQKNETASQPDHSDDEEERLLFEEIEEIYRYVREGGDPPAPRAIPTSASTPLTIQSDVLRDFSDSASSQKFELETQEAVLNLLQTSSAEDQALLVDQGHAESPEDDGYWEEPIYEDIAKIRERKMAERTSAASNKYNDPAYPPPDVNTETEQRSETGLTTERKPATKTELGFRPETETKIEPKEELGLRLETETKPGTKAEPASEMELVENPLEPESKTTEMVQNLRQLFLPSVSIRLASSLKRTSTAETSTDMLELTATETPPIPPKCFDDTTRLEMSSTICRSPKLGARQSNTGDIPEPVRTMSVHDPTVADIPAGPKSPPPKVLPKKPPTVRTPTSDRRLSERALNSPARNGLIKNESVSLVSGSQSATRNSPLLSSGRVSPKPSETNQVSMAEVTKIERVSLLHESKESVSASNGVSSEPLANPVSANHLSGKRVSTPEVPKSEIASPEQKPKNPFSAAPKLVNQIPGKPISTPKIQKSEAVSLAPSPKNFVSAESKLENPVPAEDAVSLDLAKPSSVSQIHTVSQNPVPMNTIPLNQISMKPVCMNQPLVNQLTMNPATMNTVPMNQVPVNQVPVNPVPMNQHPINQVAMNQASITPTLMNQFPTNTQATNPVPMHPVSANPVSANPVLVSANSVSVKNTLTATTLHDSSRSVTPDPLPFRRSESPPRQIIITNTPTRANWSSGSTIHVGTDAKAGVAATAVNGVTTIKVTAAPRLDHRNSPQGHYPSPGNTLVHVRLPNSSIGHAIYRPQGATSGMRIQSGTVYLTNSRGVENDQWA